VAITNSWNVILFLQWQFEMPNYDCWCASIGNNIMWTFKLYIQKGHVEHDSKPTHVGLVSNTKQLYVCYVIKKMYTYQIHACSWSYDLTLLCTISKVLVLGLLDIFVLGCMRLGLELWCIIFRVVSCLIRIVYICLKRCGIFGLGFKESKFQVMIYLISCKGSLA
jgi:hypothetical protein